MGLSYRHAGIQAVARFSIPKTDLASRLPALRQHLGMGELVFLGTCNRVEVMYATRDGATAEDCRGEVFRALTGQKPEPGEASRLLRAWTGEAAIEHLFLVACGLDSAQAGEREIAAQLRGAWDCAREAGTCGPVLDRLLGEALAMASRVHRLEAAARAPSLADQAAERVRRHPPASQSPVALIGVSPMTKRCGLALRRDGVGLLIVNRTLAPAREFAEVVQGEAMSLDDFRARPPVVGALVLAAGGSGPLLDATVLGRIAAEAPAAPLIVDFGVPPNVEPADAQAAGLPRIGMDDLIETVQERRLTELLRLAPVRAAIDERLGRLRAELATRAIGPRLADLRGTFEHIASEEIDRALAGELRDLDAGQREALQRLGSLVARRLAHLPLAGLRAAAEHAGAEAVDAFFREARLSRGGPGVPAQAGAAAAAHHDRTR